MQVTIDLDDVLLARVEDIFGPKPLSELVPEALRHLLAKVSAKRLIELGGIDPNAEAAPRRRVDPF